MSNENIVEVTEPTSIQQVDANAVSSLSTFSPRPEASQQIADQFMTFLKTISAQFMAWWQKAISEEQLATLTLVGFILVAIPMLTILIGVVNIINSIPLFSSLLELIGLGYFVWFSYRYLLFADTRRELALKTNTVKQRILGK